MVRNQAFFEITQKALDSFPNIYDFIWPMKVSLENFRKIVKNTVNENPEISELELAKKYSGKTHGVNYRRAFIETKLEDQEQQFAWILLNDSFALFEGWLEELNEQCFSKQIQEKSMQFPKEIKNEIGTLLKKDISSFMKKSFYSVGLSNKYQYVEDLLYCYRAFKEARNCYMHHGGIANKRLIYAYEDFIQNKANIAYCVNKIPCFTPPVEGNAINLSIYGVVGFTSVLREIMLVIDNELRCTNEGEKEFSERFKRNYSQIKSIDRNKSKDQVQNCIKACGFPGCAPAAISDVINYLAAKKLIVVK